MQKLEPIDTVYVVFDRYDTIVRVFAKYSDALAYAQGNNLETTEPVAVWGRA